MRFIAAACVFFQIAIVLGGIKGDVQIKYGLFDFAS